MPILINRFEQKQVMERDITMKFQNTSQILIKDHKTDNIIGHINLRDNIDENKELGNRIITVIENYINEVENG